LPIDERYQQLAKKSGKSWVNLLLTGQTPYTMSCDDLEALRAVNVSLVLIKVNACRTRQEMSFRTVCGAEEDLGETRRNLLQSNSEFWLV